MPHELRHGAHETCVTILLKRPAARPALPFSLTLLFATMWNCHAQPDARRKILHKFAKNSGSKHGFRCAIPGCPNRGVTQQCRKQRLCVACLARTLRTAFDDRLRTRCPFCRKTLLRPGSVVKKLMCVFPSHAVTMRGRSACSAGTFPMPARPIRFSRKRCEITLHRAKTNALIRAGTPRHCAGEECSTDAESCGDARPKRYQSPLA